jgi:hypothetical protein
MTVRMRISPRSHEHSRRRLPAEGTHGTLSVGSGGNESGDAMTLLRLRRRGKGQHPSLIGKAPLVVEDPLAHGIATTGLG